MRAPWLLSLIIPLTACKQDEARRGPSKAELAPTCEQQATRYGKQLADAMVQQGLAAHKASIVTEQVVTACREDAWSDTVLTCLSAFLETGAEDSSQTCMHGLTEAQTKRLDERVIVALRNAAD